LAAPVKQNAGGELIYSVHCADGILLAPPRLETLKNVPLFPRLSSFFRGKTDTLPQ